MKKETEAKRQTLGELLPVKPRTGFMDWIMMEAEEYLGRDFLIYKRESIPAWYQGECNGYEFLAESGDGKSHWGSLCKCTACGETFTGGWHEGHLCLYMREDGYYYEGVTDLEDEDACEFREGDHLNCPRCDAEVQTVRAKDISAGRTYRVQAASLERCGDYAAAVWWLVTRRLDPYGGWSVSAEPRDAIVIGEKRKLLRYSHTFKYMGSEGPTPTWEYRKTFTDPEQSAFYSYQGGMPSRNTVGAFYWDDVPELEGSTGEKSGIGEWFRMRRCGAAEYLKLEKQIPQLENLVKSGWGKFVEDAYLTASGIRAALAMIDTDEVKPHRMLRMSKEEFRSIPVGWDFNALRLWNRIRDSVRPAEFEELVGKVGLTDAERIVTRGWPLRETVRYLEKQTGIPIDTRTQFLVDYRDTLEEIYVEPEREADMFPPDLRAAHDAAMGMKKAAKDAVMDAKFRKLAEEYSPLEWTDGELCIVLPRCNQDLISEGSTLHHCVGRYGKQHLGGEPIFFVRHYRRPERSYYTLNEDLRGDTPRRVQLHGYGNEFHSGKNGKKGGHHRIPPEVKAFCDRWENEVLLPWFEKGKKRAVRKAG